MFNILLKNNAKEKKVEFPCFLSGRILTPEKFENEMVNTYKGLSVEGATRAGKLGTYVALPNTALALFGAGLLTFLQGRISKICRNVYPVVWFIRINDVQLLLDE